MDLGISGRVAVVTAASQGLGRACAGALAKEGCRIAICSRREKELNDASEEIRQATGTEVLPVRCDLSQASDNERLVRSCLDHFGKIGILVANVGHPAMDKFLALSDADWLAGFEGILLPAIRLCRSVIPTMQKHSWGRIVHIASVALKKPGSPFLLSSVFRAGVAALSKSLASEFGHDGILVNTVCPGPFKTPLGEELLRRSASQQGQSVEEAEATTAAGTALGRMGNADELAAAVAWLCSTQTSFITGQLVTVDGGMVKTLL